MASARGAGGAAAVTWSGDRSNGPRGSDRCGSGRPGSHRGGRGVAGIDGEQLQHQPSASLARADAGCLGQAAEDEREAACGDGIGGGGQQPATCLALGLGGHLRHVPADVGQGGHAVERRRCIRGDVRIDQPGDRLVVSQTDRLPDIAGGDPLRGEGEDLVEQGLGVTHATVGQPGDEVQRLAVRGRALGLTMRASLPAIVASARRLKSWRWVRLMIVGGTLWVSVVARMKTTCSGGSSISLSSALNACVLSMWTSSMM